MNLFQAYSLIALVITVHHPRDILSPVNAFTPVTPNSPSTDWRIGREQHCRPTHLYSTESRSSHSSSSSSLPKQEGRQDDDQKAMDLVSSHFNDDTTSLQKEVDSIAAFAEAALQEVEGSAPSTIISTSESINDTSQDTVLSSSDTKGVSSQSTTSTSEVMDKLGSFFTQVGKKVGSTIEATLDAALLSKDDTADKEYPDSLIDKDTIENVKEVVSNIDTTLVMEKVEEGSKMVQKAVDNVMKDVDMSKEMSKVGDLVTSGQKLLEEVVPKMSRKDGLSEKSEDPLLSNLQSVDEEPLISKAAKIGDDVSSVISDAQKMAGDIFQTKLQVVQEAYNKVKEEKRIKDEELAIEREFNEALRINRLKARSKSLQLDDRKKARPTKNEDDSMQAHKQSLVESLSGSASRMLKKEREVEPSVVVPTSTALTPPQGIPVISKWAQNDDKTITGLVSGASAFKDGQQITTSPIQGECNDCKGGVVTTASGSRYYLEPNKSVEAIKKDDDDDEDKSNGLGGFGKSLSNAFTKSKHDINSAIDESIKPITKVDRKEKKVMWKTPKILSSAPNGIPTIYDWKPNRDSSVTGFVSGSKVFEEDQKITTSPIRNDVVGGTVVKTQSGSRYFLKQLETKKSISNEPRKTASEKEASIKLYTRKQELNQRALLKAQLEFNIGDIVKREIDACHQRLREAEEAAAVRREASITKELRQRSLLKAQLETRNREKVNILDCQEVHDDVSAVDSVVSDHTSDLEALYERFSQDVDDLIFQTDQHDEIEQEDTQRDESDFKQYYSEVDRYLDSLSIEVTDMSL